MAGKLNSLLRCVRGVEGGGSKKRGKRPESAKIFFFLSVSLFGGAANHTHSHTCHIWMQQVTCVCVLSHKKCVLATQLDESYQT